MKFSAEDIAQQGFQTRFRGLDPEQVREFLGGLAREWDQLAGELKRLQSEVDGQSKELRDYRRRERSLVEALEMAKQVADEIRHQAERDSELVIARTELKAEKILAQAERRVADLRGEMQDLHQQRIRFKTQLRHLLDGHSQMLDAFGEEQGDAYATPPLPPKTPAAFSSEERYDVDDEDVEASHPVGPTDEIRRRPSTLTGFQGEANA